MFEIPQKDLELFKMMAKDQSLPSVKYEHRCDSCSSGCRGKD